MGRAYGSWNNRWLFLKGINGCICEIKIFFKSFFVVTAFSKIKEPLQRKRFFYFKILLNKRWNFFGNFMNIIAIIVRIFVRIS